MHTLSILLYYLVLLCFGVTGAFGGLVVGGWVAQELVAWIWG